MLKDLERLEEEREDEDDSNNNSNSSDSDSDSEKFIIKKKDLNKLLKKHEFEIRKKLIEAEKKE